MMTESQMSEALGDFGFNVLKRLSTSSPGAQIFISPSSLEMALALTAGGAKGATQDCIFEAMGLQGASYSEAAAYFRNLSGRLSGADERCSLELANSIWIHKCKYSSRRNTKYKRSFICINACLCQ